jgi:predicted nicotinamide N-methyase
MLSSHYKIKEETIHIGRFAVRMFRITNIDELFNDLVAKDPGTIDVKDERIPYWADLWPSALGLSRYIAETGTIKPGTKVLEIGCGLGLPGVVAGMMGAEVTFTDYMPEPLDLARMNWKMNNNHRASFELLDWRNGMIKSDAGIILASDVAYESRMFSPLLQFVISASAEGRTILLSEPGRRLAKPFLEELHDKGLVMHSVSYTIKMNGIDNAVSVYEL